MNSTSIRSTRKLRARPHVAPPAVMVSQFTAPALFGFKSERAFLEFVLEYDVPRTKSGKTVLVDVDDLRVAIRRLASSEAANGTPDANSADDAPTPDDILASLGVRRAK